MKIRRKLLTRLKILLALVFLAALGGAVLLYFAAPQVALLVAGVGLMIAVVGYLMHRNAATLFASALLYPVLALGIYALHVLFGVPTQYLTWISIAVFALVVLVLTADEVPM